MKNNKKLNEDQLKEFRTRFNIPLSDEQVVDAPFYRPAEDSPEMKYMRERRAALGGAVPQRHGLRNPINAPKPEDFADLTQGSKGRDIRKGIPGP